MREQKAAIRADRLALREAMTAEARADGAKAMALSGDLLGPVRGKVVSGFWPIRSEADIRPLMARLAEKGAQLALPVVLDRETILFRAFRPEDRLVPTGFGSMGPDEDASPLDPDVMLVPLSAFDATGHRIGYGGGYYDRVIARLVARGRRPRLIGIAFACQEVASVPFEPHDIPLDAILTEQGLRIFETGSARYETSVPR